MSIFAIIIASAGLSMGIAAPEPKSNDKPQCALCPTQTADKLPEIDSALYGNAAWPEHNKADIGAKNLQGQKMPVAFGKETMLSEGMELKDLHGKVLIIDFWATWCGPCIAAAPKLAQIQKTYEGDLQVVGVSGLREDEQTVRSFIEKHDEPFMHLYDDKQTVYKQFDSKWIPLVVVISTDGVIRWMGNPHDNAFKAAVEQVMKADPLIKAKG